MSRARSYRQVVGEDVYATEYGPLIIRAFNLDRPVEHARRRRIATAKRRLARRAAR